MRELKLRRFLAAGAILALLGPVAGGAAAQDAAAMAPRTTPATICGHSVSEAVQGLWTDLGGESGRLGCATESETPTATSARGSRARATVFGSNGEIIAHESGPRAGQAYAVWGCFYRLYVQFSGTGGWLGLPLAEAETTPDGSKQLFEGGVMHATRAYDDCEAEPVAPTPPAIAPDAAFAALDLFENPATGDRLSLMSAASQAEATAAGYRRLRGQARVLAEATPGAIRLGLFEDEAAGRKQTLAVDQSRREAVTAGYVFEAGQGYVWTDPRPGAVALKLFRDPKTGRARLTAGDVDEREAVASGSLFVRIEGYAEPAP
jgi:hypothetical protein